MWLLPSLGRPEGAWEVAKLAQDVPIVLRLHREDPRLEEYLEKDWPEGWKIVVGRIAKLATCLRLAFEEYPEEQFYGFLADDVRPSPENWAELLETAAGSDYVAYPDDGLHGSSLCTHPCIGGDLVRSVGWWVLPGVEHSFFDTAWMALGSATGRLRYVEQVKYDHRHPLRDTTIPMDSVYELGQVSFEADKQVFTEWLKESIR